MQRIARRVDSTVFKALQPNGNEGDLLSVLDSAISAETSTAQLEWEQFVVLKAVLDKLLEVQQTASKPAEDDNKKKLDAFTQWLVKNEYPLDKFPLGFATGVAEGGNGVVATRAIDAGQPIAVVPAKLMLPASQLHKSTALAHVVAKDPIVENVPGLALALVVLDEALNKKQDSFWAPYLDVLPRSFSIPLFFTVDEVWELRGSPALGEVTRLVKSTTRQYLHLRRLLKSTTLAQLSYEQFRWAVSVSMTRQNRLPLDGPNKPPVLALVPVFDMCNHTTEGTAITSEYNLETNALEVNACRNFAQGGQVYIFYGPRSNADLLVYSGFVPATTNAHNAVRIKLALSKDDVEGERRAFVLKSIGLPAAGELPLGPDFLKDDVSAMLRAYIQVFVLSPATLNTVAVAIASKIQKKSPLQLIEENLADKDRQAVKAFLKTRCELLLRLYPTTIEEDQKALLAVGSSAALQNIIRLRVAEKQILQATSKAL